MLSVIPLIAGLFCQSVDMSTVEVREVFSVLRAPQQTCLRLVCFYLAAELRIYVRQGFEFGSRWGVFLRTEEDCILIMSTRAYRSRLMPGRGG